MRLWAEELVLPSRPVIRAGFTAVGSTVGKDPVKCAIWHISMEYLPCCGSVITQLLEVLRQGCYEFSVLGPEWLVIAVSKHASGEGVPASEDCCS